MRRYARKRVRRETDRVPIPNDWDGSSMAFALICLPDSSMWRAAVRGVISKLGIGWHWDKDTGSHVDAATVGRNIERDTFFMSAEQLFSKLDGIKDAINNLDFSDAGVQAELSNLYNLLNVRLANIEDGVGSAANHLGGIKTYANSIAVDIVDLKAEIRDAINNLSNIVFELPVAFDTIVDEGFKDKQIAQLLLIQDVLERHLTYASTQTDFYGQTMTTQSGILKDIVSAIYAIQQDINVVCTKEFTGAPVPTTPDPIVDQGDKILNAVVYHDLVSTALETMSQSVPDVLFLPEWFAEVTSDALASILLAISIRSGLDAAEAAATLLTNLQNGASYNWATVKSEWDGLEFNLVCDLAIEGDPQDEQEMMDLADAFVVAEGTQALQAAYTAIRGSDAVVYVYNEYLGGDRSALYNSFQARRNQLRDGFDPQPYVDWCS